MINAKMLEKLVKSASKDSRTIAAPVGAKFGVSNGHWLVLVDATYQLPSDVELGLKAFPKGYTKSYKDAPKDQQVDLAAAIPKTLGVVATITSELYNTFKATEFKPNPMRVLTAGATKVYVSDTYLRAVLSVYDKAEVRISDVLAPVQIVVDEEIVAVIMPMKGPQ